MSVDRLKIWEVVQLFAEITEEQSRSICQEFIDATLINISINDYADETTEHRMFLEHMYEICTAPANYGLDLTVRTGPDMDNGSVFFYSRKVPVDEVDSYVTPVQGNYYCTICSEDFTHDGVGLSCVNRNNSCTFCKPCIFKWITENVAKCPNCAMYLNSLQSLA